MQPAANGLRAYRLRKGDWSVGEDWVWIPSGEFLMGSPMYEAGRNGDEGPQRVVTIRRGFWMARHETTQVEFLDTMGFNPSYMPFDASRPVEMVTFDQAEAYCAALTRRGQAQGTLPPGCRYRLPSEAEWEYACRAGTTTRYSYGEDLDYTLLDEHGWAGVNAGHLTHPVGLLRPNRWGLYDMHGNVFEWCLDYYGAYPEGDREGYEKGRVYRGGSWYCPSDVLRSASRHPGTQLRSYFIGFRVVLGAEPDTVLPLWEVDGVKPALEWAGDGTSVRVRGECSTAESWVVYTTNGWTPYATGVREPPVVTKALTVRMVAFRKNYTQSPMVAVAVAQLATPHLEVSGGVLRVVAWEPGVAIEYRWDGGEWLAYGGGVELPAGPGEVEARVRKAGWLTSAVARRSF